MVYRSNSGWGKILFQSENVNLYTAIQKLLPDLNIKEGSKSSQDECTIDETVLLLKAKTTHSYF